MQHSQCGVSDYSMILGQFMTSNNDAAVKYCSLNDNYITEVQQTASMLRMPKTLAISKRKELFNELVSSFQPSLLVLNYAAYGLHKKGFPFWLSSLLSVIKKIKCSVVIVFHELWIGHFSEERIKAKLLGKLQKTAIKKLVHSLQPIQTFVTTQVSQKMLASVGIKSQFLHVFSNLGDSNELTNEEEQVIQTNIIKNNNGLLLSFFGSIFGFTDTVKTTKFLQQQAIATGKTIVVFSIGKLNNESLETWNKLAAAENENLKFVKIGMVSSNLANALLQKMDYGLSPYPIAFWSKSGSMAAMLANELQVIAVGDDTSNMDGYRKGLEIHPSVLQLDIMPEKFVLQKRKGQYTPNGYNNSIYQSFINHLALGA